MTRQPKHLKDRIVLNGQTIWLHSPQGDCYICRGANHIYLNVRECA